MKYEFNGKVLIEQRYNYFNDLCLQNNDIHKPFVYEGESYFITFGHNEVNGDFRLVDSNGYSLNSSDYATVLNYGKSQLKKGEFFIGKNIGSVFQDDYDNKPWAINLRVRLLKQLQSLS
jgi:hypothetical protein